MILLVETSEDHGEEMLTEEVEADLGLAHIRGYDTIANGTNHAD